MAAKGAEGCADSDATEDSVEVSNRQRAVRVAVEPLRKFLRDIKNDMGLSGSKVTVRLVSDPVIARMNESFRNIKRPTDVLSFPASERRKPARIRSGEPAVPCGTILGDIAISPQTARRYAKQYGRALPIELQILILHGVLHLLGYDHEEDTGEMTRVEQRLRRRYGLPQ
ncbi:MAG: rRNA maturation RNase YbeY [Candidatus Acidiferrum sp.]